MVGEWRVGGGCVMMVGEWRVGGRCGTMLGDGGWGMMGGWRMWYDVG